MRRFPYFAVVSVLLLPVAVAVGLSTPAQAASAAVTDGDARFEVLTPTLIRMEYAGDAVFTDATTFNAINRSFPVPSYTTDVTSDGYREIHTASLLLRYKQNSGPFTPTNLSVTVNGVTAAPEFPSYCAVNTVCEAEDGLLGGNAATAYDHVNHTGSGFVAGFSATGSSVSADISAVPSAGTYRLAVRYANATGGDGQTTTRTLGTTVNGTAGPTVSFPTTASWDTWSTASVNVSLRAGTNTISLVQSAGTSGNLNVDSMAVAAGGYPAAVTNLTSTGYGAGPTDTLGGWSRSLDNPATLPVPEHPGILDKDGWYLLDDSRTALLSSSHVVTDRASHGASPYEDGYFFGYGSNDKQGLADLNALTGSSDLLPESAYGVWYSRYYPYSTSDYENTLLPAFRSNFTPVDWLVIDTDWKSPSQWNGWNWNSSLFPDPQSFLNWTKTQGLSVSMNIHTSIAGNDPQFATANSTAGGLIPDGSNYDFDWSKPSNMTAYFNLHQPFEQQGVRTWWLDYCTGCGASTASDQHVAPDNLINQAYADDAAAKGVRGFSFARIGGSEMGSDDSNYAIGPWSERRNTMQFTGDTPATWDMLAFEARFAPDEAAAGITQVSDDIGSFHGNHLADDMYVRWVQLGAFQPIDRLHSDHGDRLPWNYTGAAATDAAAFLRLRESLVPYTYTLAHQANQTGVPITEPLYLDYPTAPTGLGEYLYGDNVLVTPITSADDANGNGSASVWVPPGTWTDYFTGTSYTGPSTVTITDPLSEMPVLIKSGGIMPARTDYVDNANQKPLTQLTLNVAAGADGTFTMYSDPGEGSAAQNTNAPFTWTDSSHTLTVGAVTGSYTGAVTSRSYTLRLKNATAPTAVDVDGVQVPETAWAWNSNSRTVTVTTAALPTTTSHTVALVGAGSGNPASGEVLGDGGNCLDIKGAATADGTAAQLYTCNHTNAQQVTWSPTAGTAQVLGKCLTVSGSAVSIATCNGLAAQKWTHTAAGTLLNGTNCLAVPGGNTSPGAVQLSVAACDGSAAQLWKLPPGPVVGPGGLCGDVANAQPASGTAVQLYGCNGSDAQRWSEPGDGTIRTYGKCLDVTSGGTANGTKTQLFDCNGSGSQVWQTRTDGTLYNPQSGRCLDDPDNAQQNGDLLQIYDCNTTAAQKFTL